jgi:hypothetical protein
VERGALALGVESKDDAQVSWTQTEPRTSRLITVRR